MPSRFLGVIALCAVASGCSCSGKASAGGPCATTADCNEGLACVSGTCVEGVGAMCAMDSDCTPGLRCVAGMCSAPDLTDGGPPPDVMTGCGEFEFAVRPGAPPDLMLVVDRSLSMDDDLPGGGGTKWE